MKNWIAIGVIAVSFAVIAQPGKGNNKGNSEQKGKSEVKVKAGNKNGPIRVQGKSGNIKIDLQQKGQKPNGKGSKGYRSNGKGQQGKGVHHSKKGNPYSGKHAAKYHYKQGHPNYIYMYSFSPFSYPTKNYGQWRSEQARNKHKKYKPSKEKEVSEAIIIIGNRNAFLLVEVDNKFARLRNTLRERRDAGLITDVQFSLHMSSVQTLSSRRARYSY